MPIVSLFIITSHAYSSGIFVCSPLSLIIAH
uniref:Uncharacterized protein n=1 Tax=Vitis vinifera TaxID=29760 RepID=F6HUL6_VITVI